MICYHGTSRGAATNILKEGFWADTWFATQLVNAIKFGGPYIFEVDFKDDPILKEWQFHHPKPILANRIVSLIYYSALAALDAPPEGDEI